jgi:phosphoribosylformylglycinamidine synthase
MAFAGALGLEINLQSVPYNGEPASRLDPVLLFSESATRFLVEVPEARAGDFEHALDGVTVARIGSVTDSGNLLATGLDGTTAIESSIAGLKAAWQTPLLQH